MSRSCNLHRPGQHIDIPQSPSSAPPPPPPKDTSRSPHTPADRWIALADAANAQYDPDDGYGGYSELPTPGGADYGTSQIPLSSAVPQAMMPYSTQVPRQLSQHALPNLYPPPRLESSVSTDSAQSRLQQYQQYDYAYPYPREPDANMNATHERSSVSSHSIPIQSSYNVLASRYAFPEPEIQRSTSLHAHSQSSLVGARPPPRQALSDVNLASEVPLSRRSSRSSFTVHDQFPQDNVDERLTEELSNLTLESDEGLLRFQSGQLSQADEEWHRLVPEAAREALGKEEVQRQSIIFEIFKSERDYVADLEAVHDVFVQPLHGANVIPEVRRDEFIEDVFCNLDEILTFHQSMLGSLFSRQREQHPLVQSVADVILENALLFQTAYDSYIKHYPLAEARHRSEFKGNRAYRTFLENIAQDPRVRKRDLVTFISRPVTRLPRLVLLLETMLKHTDHDHPDQETMPLIISILGDFVKSTQPGIEAAEAKVKFWNVMENLVFRKGELIDLDGQDESRSLIHSQTLARKHSSDFEWNSWTDCFVVILDHYLLITREDKRPHGVRYEVITRPIPLELLCLGQFEEPPESRKEKSDEGGLLDGLRGHSVPQYPFTAYHAIEKLNRRYTLYTNTEAARRKWHDLLVSAIGVHAARRDANKWFAPVTLNDSSFRIRNSLVPANSVELFTGTITAAATFVSGGKSFVIIGTAGGVYAGVRGEQNFRRILTFRNASYIATLQKHNKIVIHIDNILVSYSLEILARVSQGMSQPSALDASLERISGQDHVTLAKVGMMKGRIVVLYATKGFRQTTVYVLEASDTPVVFKSNGKSTSYKPLGQPFYVPRVAYDIIPLPMSVAVAGDRGVTIVDPTNLASSALLFAPDFSGAGSDSQVSALKGKCDDAKALGLVRVADKEIIIIFEEFGCYVDTRGVPTRHGVVVRWEAKVTRYADRGEYLLLFGGAGGLSGGISGSSSNGELMEVRHKATGRLVQVLEGKDLRLLNSNLAEYAAAKNSAGSGNGNGANGVISPMLTLTPIGIPGAGTVQTQAPDMTPVLATRYGNVNDQHGQSVEFFELVKTAELPPTAEAGLEDEWIDGNA